MEDVFADFNRALWLHKAYLQQYKTEVGRYFNLCSALQKVGAPCNLPFELLGCLPDSFSEASPPLKAGKPSEEPSSKEEPILKSPGSTTPLPSEAVVESRKKTVGGRLALFDKRQRGAHNDCAPQSIDLTLDTGENVDSRIVPAASSVAGVKTTSATEESVATMLPQTILRSSPALSASAAAFPPEVNIQAQAQNAAAAAASAQQLYDARSTLPLLISALNTFGSGIPMTAQDYCNRSYDNLVTAAPMPNQYNVVSPNKNNTQGHTDNKNLGSRKPSDVHHISHGSNHAGNSNYADNNSGSATNYKRNINGYGPPAPLMDDADKSRQLLNQFVPLPSPPKPQCPGADSFFAASGYTAGLPPLAATTPIESHIDASLAHVVNVFNAFM